MSMVRQASFIALLAQKVEMITSTIKYDIVSIERVHPGELIKVVPNQIKHENALYSVVQPRSSLSDQPLIQSLQELQFNTTGGWFGKFSFKHKINKT